MKELVYPNRKNVKETMSRFNKIYNVYEDSSFTEICGSIGGDNITYRIYADGRVVER